MVNPPIRATLRIRGELEFSPPPATTKGGLPIRPDHPADAALAAEMLAGAVLTLPTDGTMAIVEVRPGGDGYHVTVQLDVTVDAVPGAG